MYYGYYRFNQRSNLGQLKAKEIWADRRRRAEEEKRLGEIMKKREEEREAKKSQKPIDK